MVLCAISVAAQNGSAIDDLIYSPLTPDAAKHLVVPQPFQSTTDIAATSTSTSTGTPTPDGTSLPTSTAAPGVTLTSTPAKSITPSPTFASSSTRTPSATPTGPTPTLTPGATNTPTPTLATTVEPTGALASPSASQPAKTATITPRATYTPTASFTPLPTRTPTATPGSAYILQEQALICEPGLSQPLVQVYAKDAADNPVPGVEFVVAWGTNEEHFFTGLKPEMGLGYADFVMTPGNTYILRMADGTDLAELKPTECEGADGLRSWGIWKLTFVQP